ncbi:unnamed protein product [Fraxinus pennsylvanica]|uniref:ELMO domain-containing protein n=1 Tax=Fraxinus pennsylvanica TaxID=56036 RepID=A0AAD2DY82_9LAMI|nr:unnamed protein product [Fraxinus pennsylvanica]
MEGSNHLRKCGQSVRRLRRTQSFYWNREVAAIPSVPSVKPRTLVGTTFLKFLAENESTFDLLYCIAFKLMDHQWLAMHASYMDFNVLITQNRTLESALGLVNDTYGGCTEIAPYSTDLELVIVDADIVIYAHLSNCH